MIFEKFFESREVPAHWKLVSVVLVFKKSKKEDPRNCRPVSLTSVPTEIMEKVILGGVEKHLQDNSVTGHKKHGFLRGQTCLSNLISFYFRITHLGDLGKAVDVKSKSFWI